MQGEARVIAIEPRRVWLLRDGLREVLTLFEEPPSSNHPDRRQVREVQRVGRDAFVISRAALERRLRDPGALSQGGTVLPYYTRGTVSGFRVVNLSPGGIFPRIGLRDQDVVRSVNGMALDSVAAALRALARFRSASRFVVDLLRGRSRRTLSYRIAP